MRLTEQQRKRRLIALDVQTLEKFTTKAELAKILGLHRNSIRTYHRKAKLLYPDYKEDALNHRFLTRFQCWILWFVQYKYAENYGDSSTTMRELRKARVLLTKSKFQWQQRQRTSKRSQVISNK